MHHLDPAIRTMRDNSTRLAVALGTVRYLRSAVGSDDDATVDNALNVLETVERDLGDTLDTLLRLGAQLSEMTEDILDVTFEPEEMWVSPSPDREGLDIGFGDVRIIAPAGPALDQLLNDLTEMHRVVSKTAAAAGAR